MAAPTCQVVKRDGEKGARIYPKGCKVRTLITAREQGHSGRIYSKETKQGFQKRAVVQRGTEHEVIVFSHIQKHEYQNATPAERRNMIRRFKTHSYHNVNGRRVIDWNVDQTQLMIYDTGAQSTTANPELFSHLGFEERAIIEMNGRQVKTFKLPNARGPNTNSIYYAGLDNITTSRSFGVGGPVETTIYHGVPFSILIHYSEDGSTQGDFADVTSDLTMMPSGGHNLLGVNTIKQIQKRYKVKFKL